MASDQVISARVPQEIFDRFGAFVTAEYGTERGARTAAVIEALTAQMAGRVVKPSIKPTKINILAAMEELGPSTCPEIAGHLRCSANQVSKRMGEMRDQNRVVSVTARFSKESSRRLDVWTISQEGK